MYQDMIRTHAARLGFIGIDPRHVEAIMRLEHGTLDSLSRSQFNAEIEAAIPFIVRDKSEAESLAQSFGL